MRIISLTGAALVATQAIAVSHAPHLSKRVASGLGGGSDEQGTSRQHAGEGRSSPEGSESSSNSRGSSPRRPQLPGEAEAVEKILSKLPSMDHLRLPGMTDQAMEQLRRMVVKTTVSQKFDKSREEAESTRRQITEMMGSEYTHEAMHSDLQAMAKIRDLQATIKLAEKKKPGQRKTQAVQRGIIDAVDGLSHGKDPATRRELERIRDAAVREPHRAGGLLDRVLQLANPIREAAGGAARRIGPGGERHKTRERLEQKVRDRERQEQMKKSGMAPERYKEVAAREPVRQAERKEKGVVEAAQRSDISPDERLKQERKEQARKEAKQPMPKEELKKKVHADVGAKEGQGTSEAVPPEATEEALKAQRAREKNQRKYQKKKEKKAQKDPGSKEPPRDGDGSGSEAGHGADPRSG